MLRVSQASVRRWSDSGLLEARRVGRRRERRFTQRDLENFLKPGSSARSPSATALERDVFVGGTHVPVHSHLATFYASDEARLRLTLPFLRDGLLLGEPCFLAAEGALKEAYLEALRREPRIDIDAAIRAGSFRIVAGPCTDVEGALAFWSQAMSEVLAAGPTLIRVVGEMASERTVFPTDDEMIKYEVAYNLIAKRFPTVTMCQYDVRMFGGETIFGALRAHTDLFELGLASFLI
ncbi:MAG: helix-turn-helix domain-containing protein [Chloroflexi bacterium]|nr:MAG: helix-turn-helix domain-containing protein [Chloroflexota bacterium]